ncbi:MAG: DoxX family protein [bacterium]|nr:DoxX family protein [bacterium]
MEGSSSAGRYAGIGLATVRMVLGFIFIAHGYYKVIGFDDAGLGGPGGLGNLAVRMTQMGMPLPLIYLLSFGELLAGLGLFFGFLSRLSAFGIMIIMIGAIIMVHLPGGFFINWAMAPNASHGFEYNLALIAMCWGIILGGPGSLALDNLFFGKR